MKTKLEIGGKTMQSLEMMAIARTVELAAKSEAADAEDANDDADKPSRMQSEFVGGEHDI